VACVSEELVKSGFRLAHMKKNLVEWRSSCPVSSGLDILGDKWSLLIVRDLLICRTRTYSEFSLSPEKISTNILADRLIRLTSLGIIERVNAEQSARNNAYRLTKSGKELQKVLEALGNWSSINLREIHPHIVSLKDAADRYRGHINSIAQG
jgi:DNA-binding HxlR family transcriptional regulator